MRTPYAFTQVENRIDRSKEIEQRRTMIRDFSKLAKTTADGVLGGYGFDVQADLLDALIRELCARRKAVSDGPAVGGLLGEIANKLCADIRGPKTGHRQVAEAAFRFPTEID